MAKMEDIEKEFKEVLKQAQNDGLSKEEIRNILIETGPRRAKTGSV